VEFLALSLITPPNGIGGGGICFPSIVTVASGEPATPLICCACARRVVNIDATISIPHEKALSPAFRLVVIKYSLAISISPTNLTN
jgi:hypothetical protein